MDVICYICDRETSDWRQNLSEIQSQHTQTAISEFIRKFLSDFCSQRNVDDETNCICAECLQQIDDYDWTCQQANEQEAKLRDLLLTTETKFSENLIEPIEIKNEIDEFLNGTAFDNDSEDAVNKFELGFLPEPDLSPPPATQLQPSTSSSSRNYSPTVYITQPAKEKPLFIRKDGKLYRARLLRKKPLSASGMTLNDSATGTILKSNSGKIFRMIVKPNTKCTSTIASAGISQTTESVYDENTINPLAEVPNEENSTRRSYKQPRPCPECGKVFTNKYFLQCHMNKHAKRCDECGLKFKRSGTRVLESHKKWHECNPGFICAVCRFTFSDADSLRDHINLHETKPYTECLFCGKNFKANSHLRYHVETHGGRNKLCDLCGKAFKTETALERHVNIHTKKRSYECSICKKQFTEYNNMKYHMKNHSDERPFSCSFCGMTFKHRKHCRAHERRHTEETKTVKCNLCSAVFEHKFHLKQHVERRHAVVISSNTN